MENNLFYNIDVARVETEGLKYKMEKSKQETQKYKKLSITLPMKRGEDITINAYSDFDVAEKIIRKFGEQGFLEPETSDYLIKYLQEYSEKCHRSDNLYMGVSPKEFEEYLRIKEDISELIRQLIDEEPIKEENITEENITKKSITEETKKQEAPRRENRYQKSGKHYVMGDIHGMYGSYMEAMKHIGKDDHLYIIGDVIDRGENGIQILKDIINRKKNPQTNPKITFLLGNHEIQFLTTLEIMKKYDLDQKDIGLIMHFVCLHDEISSLERDAASQKDEAIKDKYNKKIEEAKKNYKYEKYKKIYDEYTKTGITEGEIRYMKLWIMINGGRKTLDGYYQDLSEAEQQEMHDFLLKGTYMAVPVKAKGKDYLLVHSMPPRTMELIEKLKTGQPLRLGDVEDDDKKLLTSKREENGYSTYERAKSKGFVTICGHTPIEYGTILKNREKGYIRIDTCCGHRAENSKLSLYSIEDDEPIYIKEMEEYRSVALTDPDEFEY